MEPNVFRDLLDADLWKCLGREMKGDNIMPTYITLTRWTKKGLENVKESPSRLDMAKELYKTMGAELKEMYLVMGEYDMVIISEGPDDQTMAKLLLSIGSQGSSHGVTLRAFTEDEYRKIIAALP
jgi:uncharacterized protein with GYD domain